MMQSLHLKLKFRGKPVVERVHQSQFLRSRVDPLEVWNCVRVTAQLVNVSEPGHEEFQCGR